MNLDRTPSGSYRIPILRSVASINTYDVQPQIYKEKLNQLEKKSATNFRL